MTARITWNSPVSILTENRMMVISGIVDECFFASWVMQLLRIKMKWNEMKWIEVNRTAVKWGEVKWIKLNWIKLNWIKLNWIEVDCNTMHRTVLHFTEVGVSEISMGKVMEEMEGRKKRWNEIQGWDWMGEKKIIRGGGRKKKGEGERRWGSAERTAGLS